jgi:hypothetical protein
MDIVSFLLSNGLGALLQIFEVLQGPFGGFLAAILFNLIQCGMISHLFKMLKEKDDKISELTQDIKFLAIKTDLSPEDFAKLAENKFIRLSVDAESALNEVKPLDSAEHKHDH